MGETAALNRCSSRAERTGDQPNGGGHPEQDVISVAPDNTGLMDTGAYPPVGSLCPYRGRYGVWDI